MSVTTKSLPMNFFFLVAILADILHCHAFTRPIHHIIKHRTNFSSKTILPEDRYPSSLLSLQGGATSSASEIKEDGTLSIEKPLKFYTLENGMCPYAARTWIVLHELNIPYEMIFIGRPKPDWYLEINPRGKVPCLQNPNDNDTIIYESAICDEYLSDLAYSLDPPSSEDTKIWKLMPTTPSEKAKLRLLNDFIDTQISPKQFTFLMNSNTTKDDELKKELEDALTFVESQLESTGGPFLMGEEFTLADVHFLPFFARLIVTMRHFKQYDVSKENFPKLLEWFEVCSQKESVKVVSKTDEEIIKVYERFVKVDYSFGGLNRNK